MTLKHGSAGEASLLISSPDRKGLVAAISTFLYERGANIIDADQHQDRQLGLFFMRLTWELADFSVDEARFRREFEPLASQLQLTWDLAFPARRPRVAIFVSRDLHCLVDLLHRQQAGEIACEIPLIISNHPDAAAIAGHYEIPFIQEGDEARQLELLARPEVDAVDEVDLVVLARYMQILSPRFVAAWKGRIINVHHSFLPAFTGARPYHAALHRGVKIIGATAHYVTEELDQGPIIEQEVMRVSHRDQLEDLIQKGRDLERLVLARAVRWHLERRILLYANKTVIFD